MHSVIASSHTRNDMKLLYATSITLPSYRANRIQIISMARAWTNLLGNEFVLGVGSMDEISAQGVNYIVMGEGVKSYSLAWKYLRYIKENEFTTVYCREEKLLFFMMLYNSLFFRMPLTFCYELHHLVYMDVWWHKFLLNRIDYLISITGTMREALVGKEYLKEHTLVAPDAADISLFDIAISRHDARAKLGLPFEKKIVMYTGDIDEPWKGVGTLYEASKNFGEEYLFVNIGSKPHHVTYFRSLYPDRPNFLLLGHKPHAEIPLYLKSADVVVLPNSGKNEISRVSTSPMKLFEYMASGTPIVASDLQSIREILNERNAILVEPDNPGSLSAGIVCTLENPEQTEALAGQARCDVEKYTWDKRAAEIVRFIKK